MTLIDLDQPEAGPAQPPRRSRVRLAAAGLAVVVAAGVAGGVVADRWRAQQQQDADQAAVSVVLLPDPVPRPDDGVVVDQVAGASVTQVDLAAHVDVVNAGPVPVSFVGFQADRPGLQLRGDAAVRATPVAPGDFTVGTVHATVICASRPPSGSLPAVVSVRSGDGVLRHPTVTVEWRAWADRIAQTCDGPPPGIWSRR